MVPLDRARRVVLGTRMEHLEHVPKRIRAGITRIRCQLHLREINLIDERQCPPIKKNLNENEISCRAITLDGCDARHASITETMPYALFYGKDSLVKYLLNHRGWRILNTSFNNEEIQ